MSTDLWQTLKNIGDGMEARRLQREADAAARTAAKAAEAAAHEPRLVARYRTLGGGTVHVTERNGYFHHEQKTETHAACSACPATHTVDWGFDVMAADFGQAQKNFDEGGKVSTPQALAWAQEHAAHCRACESDEMAGAEGIASVPASGT
ncbi:hypothetical protein [Streptomyces longwoodensis]|uniref:hypothetical protein n=1 Tax=Streptomyces longwoodensis TaxID=68231 RepID=UPI002253A84F|nr:hypothetical protein [Streptomyces longwoodensis]MCX5000899.1 hypothetical protein [Streptomyces longwoodensis]